MPEKLMVDSGAFSVWSRGEKIDIDDYIRFCKSRPNLSVIVSLDVIPPKGVRLTEEVKEQVCKEGWANYLKMIRHLPMDKVVPVFHRGENWKWLDTFLDFGCPYIGLSPRYDGAPMERRHKFVAQAKKHIYDSTGNPITKVHGFAVTGHEMMMGFKWYSVDSASHTQLASWGSIIVPPLVNGKWDFRTKPYRIFCSTAARGAVRNKAEHHLLAMQEQRPALFAIVKKWLDEHNVILGEHRIEKAKNGRTPKKGVMERWEDHKKTKILTITKPGVCNHDQVRRFMNIAYFQKCNEAIDIPNLYLAGHGPCTNISDQIRYRLASFVERKLIDWCYERLGWYRRPLEFPYDEELNFSMKDPKRET